MSDVTMQKVTPAGARASRDAMAKGIYGKLFDWLVQHVSKCLHRVPSDTRTIGILDIFGFEVFETNLFEQLCINYANEKLQQHFNNYIFKLEQDEYVREGIDVKRIDFVDNVECLALVRGHLSLCGVGHCFDLPSLYIYMHISLFLFSTHTHTNAPTDRGQAQRHHGYA
jgi:myosin-5